MQKWIKLAVGLIAAFGVAWVLYMAFNPRIMDRLREEWQVEAKAQLTYICNLQKSHHQETGTYTMSLDELGFMQQEGDGSQFWIEIGLADSTRFIARAVATRDFDRDGKMNIWEVRENCELTEIVED
jgi:type IV pilus assembly protein PilE